jgi:hypothetical protein
MKNEEFCVGHTNGFEHLDRPLGGLEDEFDVGIKIRKEESDQYVVDPSTGVNWAEPRLVLYASVAHQNSAKIRKTLRYGLTRSAYGTQLNSIDEANPMLLKLALPALESDLSLLKSEKEPDSAAKIVMLCW